MATHSCLENPMDRGAWWATVHGVAKSRTRLSDFTFTFHFHALEKEMATHSSVLAWRIPGMAGPGGLPSMGSHRVGHDWSDLAAAAATEQWKSENKDIQKRNTRFKLLVSIDVQLAANFAKNFKSLLSISIVILSWTCNRYFSDLQQCTNHALALLWIPLLISQPHAAAWLVLGIRLKSGMRLTLLSSPPPPLEKACRL